VHVAGHTPFRPRLPSKPLRTAYKVVQTHSQPQDLPPHREDGTLSPPRHTTHYGPLQGRYRATPCNPNQKAPTILYGVTCRGFCCCQLCSLSSRGTRGPRLDSSCGCFANQPSARRRGACMSRLRSAQDGAGEETRARRGGIAVAKVLWPGYGIRCLVIVRCQKGSTRVRHRRDLLPRHHGRPSRSIGIHSQRQGRLLGPLFRSAAGRSGLCRCLRPPEDLRDADQARPAAYLARPEAYSSLRTSAKTAATSTAKP
jgi:hypothetical protein